MNDLKVHGDNGSSVARLVRDACTDQLRLPRLEGLTPIQMTLEIGLEKFRRDYVDAFGTSGLLANCALLQPLFRTEDSPEDQAEALRPLHASFEVVTICQNFLKLPVHKLTAIAREVLHRFCYKRDQPYEDLSFELQVGVTDVPSAILEITSPLTWSIESTFKQANATVARSAVHFRRQPLCSFAAYKLEPTDDSQSSKSSSEFYYCTQFTESFIHLR
uniref:Protein zwilch n=1 Tax=Plectus sambesii TaxID=2011161 RepID=A0A914UTY0_9BILA